jgi:prepilin-type N-terminal cleavage/methylation domain-containing protein
VVRQGGFTLVEVAIVIVITGLLMGWILKGQELITSARVRNLISQQDGIKAAYYGFYDRYRALPGDYRHASTSIAAIGTACAGNGNGDGDGRIEDATAASDEYILVWEHLSKSGFLYGSYTCNPVESIATTPTNPFAVFLGLAWDARYAVPGAAVPSARHNLKTGNQISSDILAEVDRKIDDGSATSGSFRFSDHDGGGGSASTGPGACYLAAVPNQWNAANPATNCGGTTLF